MSSAPPVGRPPKLTLLDLVLVTGRLRLRPLQESDVGDIWPVVSDPEFPKMMSWAAHTEACDMPVVSLLGTEGGAIFRGPDRNASLHTEQHDCPMRGELIPPRDAQPP